MGLGLCIGRSIIIKLEKICHIWRGLSCCFRLFCLFLWLLLFDGRRFITVRVTVAFLITRDAWEKSIHCLGFLLINDGGWRLLLSCGLRSISVRLRLIQIVWTFVMTFHMFVHSGLISILFLLWRCLRLLSPHTFHITNIKGRSSLLLRFWCACIFQSCGILCVWGSSSSRSNKHRVWLFQALWSFGDPILCCLIRRKIQPTCWSWSTSKIGAFNNNLRSSFVICCFPFPRLLSNKLIQETERKVDLFLLNLGFSQRNLENKVANWEIWAISAQKLVIKSPLLHF